MELQQGKYKKKKRKQKEKKHIGPPKKVAAVRARNLYAVVLEEENMKTVELGQGGWGAGSSVLAKLGNCASRLVYFITFDWCTHIFC